MSSNTAWKCLSVQDFISNCNWQGLLPKKATNSVRQLTVSLADWQCLSTQNFFALNNWDGKSTLSDSLAEENNLKQAMVFSLTLPINQFWQCFAWSGSVNGDSKTEILAAAQDDKYIPAFTEEFTLKDLSQLF